MNQPARATVCFIDDNPPPLLDSPRWGWNLAPRRFEMTRKLSFLLGFVAVLLVSGVRPAVAHHGGAAFDQAKTEKLQGTVTQLDFVNPHVGVWFDVKNSDGTSTKWSGSLTAPNKLQRALWTKHT